MSAVPTTVAELLEGRASDDGVGIRDGDRSWSWSEVVDRSAEVAAWLTAQRPAGPFHVGVLLDNTPEYLFILFGAALAGATVVGINNTRRGEELARDIRHTDCALVVTSPTQAPLLANLDLAGAPVHTIDPTWHPPHRPAATTPAHSAHPTGIAGTGGSASAADTGGRVDTSGTAEPVGTAGTGAPDAGRPAQTVGTAGGAATSGTAGSAGGRGWPRPEDLFVLIFTSGSTGAPKAVQMTHGRAARMAAGTTWLGRDDVLYSAMPLFHGNALNAIVLPALGSGATIALRDRFSALAFMDDVRRYGATFFSTVGRALSYILATPESPHDRDHRVKFALAPESSPADVRAFKQRFGIPCFGGYGSSENAIIMSPVPGMPRDALGMPAEGIDAAVVDPETMEEQPRARFGEDGRLLNAAEAIGELVGRNVVDRFEGYYRNSEADAERTRNGWYWSGDLAYRDEQGIFFFAGRVGEWLRVDSENFATAPVERILGRYTPARAVAVYAVPDERTADDQVMAAFELHEGASFDPEGFASFLEAQADLGTKWAPRYVRITTLPVGATNKIDKRPLRTDRWSTDDPLYWRPERRGPYRPFTPTDRADLEARLREHGRHR